MARIDVVEVLEESENVLGRSLIVSVQLNVVARHEDFSTVRLEEFSNN